MHTACPSFWSGGPGAPASHLTKLTRAAVAVAAVAAPLLDPGMQTRTLYKFMCTTMFMLLNKRAVLHAARTFSLCLSLSCECVCVCNGRMQHENGVWLATFYLLVRSPGPFRPSFCHSDSVLLRFLHCTLHLALNRNMPGPRRTHTRTHSHTYVYVGMYGSVKTFNFSTKIA